MSSATNQLVSASENTAGGRGVRGTSRDLFNAAPDLYDALNTLLATWESTDRKPGWVRRFDAAKTAAYAAIAKAEGR